MNLYGFMMFFFPLLDAYPHDIEADELQLTLIPSVDIVIGASGV